MKLIIGLGNPGSEYNNTRHNIGFEFIDYYLSKIDNNISWFTKFNGLFYQTIIYGEKVIFLKPQSYMNLSGDVVQKFMNFYKISSEDILVISDDLDLTLGNYKLKSKGSSGGHNGHKDIANKIGTQDYKRLKIGISNDKKYDTKDYVLGKFSDEDRKMLDSEFNELVEVMNSYFKLEFSDLMSKYNKKNR